MARASLDFSKLVIGYQKSIPVGCNKHCANVTELDSQILFVRVVYLGSQHPEATCANTYSDLMKICYIYKIAK